MQILALKLILTPFLTGLATWAGRKYGHSVSGLLIGLPLNAGPIALFLALENGAQFAATSSKGILLGAVSLSLYSIVYASLSKRSHWVLCVIAGWITYLAATFALLEISFSLPAAFVFTLLSLLTLLWVFPKMVDDHQSIIPPKWDIPLRIVLATLFIIGLTYISERLGPKLSGLLGTFPIFGTIFATTTHYLYGYNACRRLMRSVIKSLISLIAFSVVLAEYLPSQGIGPSFFWAIVACLITQAVVLFVGRKIDKLRQR